MEESMGFILYLSPTDNDVLLPIITNLQLKYCSQPPFEPHLSIYHPTKPITLDNAIKAITVATKNIDPFTIEADGFGHQNTWSKIFYINILPNKILNNISSLIAEVLEDSNQQSFVPHISLMYKDDLTDVDRNNVIAKLTIPKKYTVQGIYIQSPGKSNLDWRDYTKWINLHSIDFSK